jgi:hypothetical protein
MRRSTRNVTSRALRALLVVSLVSGCGAARGVGAAPGGPITGTLDPDALPAQPITFGPHGVSAFGLAEVPAGSRLQAAYALTDAAARAELARLLDARITSLTFAHVTEAATDARRLCLERARAALPGLTVGARGARATPDGARLRVASRIDLTPAEASSVLRPAFVTADPAALAAAVRHVTEPADGPAEAP